MKVTFNKNELTSALDRVQRAAQTKINSNTNNGFLYGSIFTLGGFSYLY